jgi:CRP-like cAMP-binding protein
MLRGSKTIYRKTALLTKTTKRSSLKHKITKMTNITLGFLGKGSVFGDIDVVLKRNYLYTLRSGAQGCSAYFLKTSAFHEYFGFYKNSY